MIMDVLQNLVGEAYIRTQSLKEAVAILHSYSDLKIDRLTIDETDVSIICWEDLSFPEQSGCFSSYKGQNAVLDLYSPLSPFGNKPLSFFDTIFLLGIPTGVDFCYIGEDFVNKPRAYATMFFDGGIQVLGDIYDLYKGEEPRLRATMTVHQIRYNVPSDETVQKWQGFGLLTNVNGC